jgi:uncharacterized protein YgiM (DUF1202 family)
MNAQSTFSRRSFLRRSAAAAVLVAGGTMSIPNVRHAIAQNGDYELVCNSDNVNLRNNPGLSSTVIGTLKAGDVVNVSGETVFQDGYGWIPMFVQRTGLSGYAADAFFERPDGGTGWFRGTPVHVTSDNVNLRSGAGLGNAIIGTFSTGTNGIIADGPRSANGYSWYNVNIDGLNGWMVEDFLAEGYVGRPSPGDAFQIGTYVRPTSDLNLRSGPGTANSVIGVCGLDTAATILDGPQSGGGHAWYKVELWDQAATVGWFAGEFLEIARFEPTGSRHRIFDGPVNLRSGSGLGAPVIRTLSTGTIVVIADASFTEVDGYRWMNVYLEADPSVRGWMAMGFSEEI